MGDEEDASPLFSLRGVSIGNVFTLFSVRTTNLKAYIARLTQNPPDIAPAEEVLQINCERPSKAEIEKAIPGMGIILINLQTARRHLIASTEML